MNQAEAFADLVSLADWSSGIGDCGFWSMTGLAERWRWHRQTVRRVLNRLERENMLRCSRSSTETSIKLLTDKWCFDGDALARIPGRDFEHEENILLSVICTVKQVPETYVRNLIRLEHGKARRRGRPWRRPIDQEVLSTWIYLLNTAAGFTAQDIHRRLRLDRKGIQSTVARIENRRDEDSALDLELTGMEAAYRAAGSVIKRHSNAKVA